MENEIKKLYQVLKKSDYNFIEITLDQAKDMIINSLIKMDCTKIINYKLVNEYARKLIA